MSSSSLNRKRKASGPTGDDDDETGKEADDEVVLASTDAVSSSSSCPYLDTIQRSVLDFDFEPTCSVSLQSGPHIYCCCVCGKYFRGRGSTTPAYTHAVGDEGHHHAVFLHLTNGSFHCLPDDYEIHDASLKDIQDALHPTFTPQQIAAIDKNNTELSMDLFGHRYLPGFVGLNNLSKTDCINAVVQALAHVRPLRDFFLSKKHTDNLFQQQQQQTSSNNNNNTQLQKQQQQHRQSVHVTQCFGELVRKIWSDQRFKSHVDPHRLVNAITATKKWKVGVQPEVGEFMAWFLHQLHLGTGGSINSTSSTKKKKKKKKGRHHKSIIEKIFQGKVRVTTRQAQRKNTKATKGEHDDNQEDDRAGSDAEDNDEAQPSKQQDVAMKDAQDDDDDDIDKVTIQETTVDSYFLQLTLDISEKPLFRDEDGGLVIPQEPLVTVLQKFDGVSFSDVIHKNGVAQRRKYALQKLPDYLILHLARFKNNQYSREKNPTIVAFPVKNLDLSNYVKPDETKTSAPPSLQQVQNMSTKELKELLYKHGRQDIADSAVEKKDLLESTIDFVSKSLPDLVADKYDLVANITHESPADVGREGKHDVLQEGSYKCHVQNRATKQWYEIQDLHVQEVMPQQIGVSESYLLIFERKSAQPQS